MSLVSSLVADIQARRRLGRLSYRTDYNLESFRGLLATLQAILAGFDKVQKASTQAVMTDPTTIAARRRIEIAIPVVQTLIEELLPNTDATETETAHVMASWSEQKQAEVATLFGVKFDVLQGHAKPLFGPIYQARLLAALVASANDARGTPLEFQKVVVAPQSPPVLLEKGFYREAYQIGRLSLSVAIGDGSVGGRDPLTTVDAAVSLADSFSRPSPATSLEDPVADPLTDPLTARQSRPELDAAVCALLQMGGEACANLMHLMSITVEGLTNFTLNARPLPAIALMPVMPVLQDLRHVHIHVDALGSQGYLFEVTAFVETEDFSREALLTFALRIDPNGRMAIHFTRPTEMRIVLLEDTATGKAT